MPQVTLAIPAYNRVAETSRLLDTVLASEGKPDEVLICEDLSPQREGLRAMAEAYRPRFEAAGMRFAYHENGQNLGYDKNLKNLARRATGDWVLYMGNDDALLKPGFGPVRAFVEAHPGVHFLSCAYEQFHADTGKGFHVQRYFAADTVVNDDAACVFRLSSFISGVCVRREWALARETDAFDGGLFYQVYLSACAFADGGIGYVATPVVGGRKGGTPLFGSAAAEKRDFAPGRIAARGRTVMYESVLRIAAHVDAARGTAIAPALRRELDSRQIFHVYEGFVGRPRSEIKELFDSLRALGLGESRVHRLLFAVAYYGGPAAPPLFRLARKLRDAS